MNAGRPALEDATLLPTAASTRCEPGLAAGASTQSPVSELMLAADATPTDRWRPPEGRASGSAMKPNDHPLDSWRL